MNLSPEVKTGVDAQGLSGHRPRAAAWLEAALGKADVLFDLCYGSKFNPLYRSGTIAMTLLSIVMVTGVYLLFFYDVSAPYASIFWIENRLWLGSTMRATHRYASDATMFAVAVHVLRILAQGKTWGPQVIALVSGVILVAIMIFAGFTGYVMVWDTFGRELAVAGAIVLDVLPFFGESLQRSFAGQTPPPSSFFFLNMFMHVALPVLMVFAMYLHTARLARSVWFPRKSLSLALVAGFTLLGAAWPAPLERAADAFTLPTSYIADAFFAAWVPLARLAPAGVLWGTVGLTLLTCLLPVLFRPAKSVAREPSKNDESTCEGCGQCTLDCPYEAIEMVPGVGEGRPPLVARVDPDLCMSCGICAGSCSRMNIGPPERTGLGQQGLIGAFLKEQGSSKSPMAFIACSSNPGALSWLAQSDISKQVDVIPISCIGDLHPFVVQRLLKNYEGVFCWGCPPRNCAFREGPTIFRQRMLEGRAPTLPGSIDAHRLYLADVSAQEPSTLLAAFEHFKAQLASGQSQPPAEPGSGGDNVSAPRPLLALSMTVLLLAGIAALSAVRLPTHAPASELLLSWRLAGQARKTCRDLTAEELASIPRHMQQGGTQCETVPIGFNLVARVDDRVVFERPVRSSGARGDQPIVVDLRTPVEPGPHRVQVAFIPSSEEDKAAGLALEFDARVVFEPGQRRALFYEKDTRSLALYPPP